MVMYLCNEFIPQPHYNNTAGNNDSLHGLQIIGTILILFKQLCALGLLANFSVPSYMVASTIGCHA